MARSWWSLIHCTVQEVRFRVVEAGANIAAMGRVRHVCPEKSLELGHTASRNSNSEVVAKGWPGRCIHGSPMLSTRLKMGTPPSSRLRRRSEVEQV